MKKLLVSSVLACLACGGLMAQGKPVIGVLIRNLNDQFLTDYANNIKK